MPKTGLILSGGGVKGVAHIAFLHRLNELGIKVDIISGASAGAMIGAQYAAGLSTKEMLQFFKKNSLFDFFALTYYKPGLFDIEKYEQSIASVIPKKFEELNIPLTVTAVDLEKGEIVYFNEGELRKPVLASCAIPLFFSPLNIDGKVYVDGGVMNNYPIEPIKDDCDILIGSYAPGIKAVKFRSINYSLQVASRSQNLLTYASSSHKFCATNFNITFSNGQFSAFDTNYIDDIFKLALEQAEEEMTEASFKKCGILS